jgi:hypothetical protein
MSTINTGKVVSGGLVAGLIMNISEYILNEPVLGTQMAAIMIERNLPAIGGSAIGVFVVMTFILGIFTIWLYAAIRPRYGAGVNTAICAGLAVWFTAYLLPSISFQVLGFMPMNMITIVVVWGAVEMMVASVAGAYFYSE